MATLNTACIDIDRSQNHSIVQQFLLTSESFLLNPATSAITKAAAGTDLHWLLRYALRCQVKLDTHQHEANALQNCFTKAAWRLVCRSNRDSFIPILRNRQLGFDSLVKYSQTLIENGFQIAPNPDLLNYFIQSSYYFFDRSPSVPVSKTEMILLRLATRHGDVSTKDFQRVDEWVAPSRGSVTVRMSWSTVLLRANDWHHREQLIVNQEKSSASGIDQKKGWHFACGDLPWRGYAINPLTNDIELWDEGQAMSSCLYRLRHLCGPLKVPSRYFSVRKNGRRYATLELVRNTPITGMKGPDRIYGQWQLQDCRLSHNRVPPDELIKKLRDFGWHYNVLSQRPNRMAPKPLPTRNLNKKAQFMPSLEQVAVIEA